MRVSVCAHAVYTPTDQLATDDRLRNKCLYFTLSLTLILSATRFSANSTLLKLEGRDHLSAICELAKMYTQLSLSLSQQNSMLSVDDSKVKQVSDFAVCARRGHD